MKRAVSPAGLAIGIRSQRRTGAVLASFLLGGALLSGAMADSPPVPDYSWPYGKALIDGANVTPEVQPVIAFVNGKVCATAQTFVATAAEGTPTNDVGRTVYVIDIPADGSGTGQRPGCGHANDPVILYFPASQRMGSQQPLFKQGGERVDLDLGVNLQYQLRAPQLAGDGAE